MRIVGLSKQTNEGMIDEIVARVEAKARELDGVRAAEPAQMIAAATSA